MILLETLLKDYVNQCQPANHEIEFDKTYGSVLSFANGMVKICVEPQEEFAWLHCSIIELPRKKREELYQSLLISQAFGKLTRGAHFSLDLGNKKILLCQAVQLENMTPSMFNKAINQFLEACLLWQATLKTQQI